MKLDRNLNMDGKGKYALIKLRELDSMPRSPEVLAQAIIDNPDLVDFGDTDDSEFFVIRLKDKHAAPALIAYAEDAHDDDQEWSNQVRRLAVKAGLHENKKAPD